MKFYSEVLDKMFDSEKELVKAERAEKKKTLQKEELNALNEKAEAIYNLITPFVKEVVDYVTKYDISDDFVDLINKFNSLDV